MRALRDPVREICSLEFLGLNAAFLPALLASIGFFAGIAASPFYFHVTVAVLSACAFCGGRKRGVAFLALLSGCAVLTALTTFAYSGCDAQNCYFPMQHLLRNGWNPVWEPTAEGLSAHVGGGGFLLRHVLFLPKFSALAGAIVASALGLFCADAFLSYMLMACLFLTSVRFAVRFWSAGPTLAIAFAVAMVGSTKVTTMLVGQADYAVYASFCLAALSLVLYVRESRPSCLALFAISSCVCVSAKPLGVLDVLVLVVLALPLVFRRIAFWRAFAALVTAASVIAVAAFVPTWKEFGSLLPSVDLTGDFTGNADALGMGYVSRICYAWISPQLTVAAVRFLSGNPGFNPVFDVFGGVAGIGPRFNALLALSAVLLAFSRKNLVTWLCVVLFVSSNFAPLKYVGYNRYFPQIWAIVPLAVMNFACACRPDRRPLAALRRAAFPALVSLMLALALFSLLRSLAFFGRQAALERLRWELIVGLPAEAPVRVGPADYTYTAVARFRQAGRQLVPSDTYADVTMQKEKSLLPCREASADVYGAFDRRFPLCNGPISLFRDFRWAEAFGRFPPVLRE